MDSEIEKQTNILYIISHHVSGKMGSTHDQTYLSHEKLFSIEDFIKFEKRSELEYQVEKAGGAWEVIEKDLSHEQLAEFGYPDLLEFGQWLIEKKGFSRVGPRNISLHITDIVEYEFNGLYLQ